MTDHDPLSRNRGSSESAGIDTLQGTAIESAGIDALQGTAIRGVRAELHALREVVSLLVQANAKGHRVDLEDESVCTLLREGFGGPRRGIGGTGIVLGRVPCPTCGAIVNDELGVTEERCVFCGGTVPTER